MITASLAAMMLAEQGARVIKVEPIELGDPMRYIGSSKGGMSALFANCNRGKESIRVDLKSADGQALIKEMVQQADVVIHNFRPGVMDGVNLGSEALRASNPKLIYMAISGFGNVGPLGDAPAYDPIIQAQSGFTAVQTKDQPEFVRNLMCDKITAYTACQAVTTALYVRERSGAGQHIDLSMMDAGLFFVFPDGFMHHTLLDDDVQHLPPLYEMLYDLTFTKDGAITMSAATERQQVNMLVAVDQVQLLADERFNSQEKLIANLAEFRALLAEAFAQFTTEELMAKLREHDVPCARFHTHEEVLQHPQYASMGSVEVVDHPVLGSMRIIRSPAMFGGERLEPSANSPAHGEHTLSVLKDFGVTDEQISGWLENGVVV